MSRPISERGRQRDRRLGDLHFVRLALIPRNEMGKIDRGKLEQAVIAARFPQEQ